MAIYENYFIGAFIHAAGLKAGFRYQQVNLTSSTDPVALGLYQQTPLDQPLGDLLWGRGGRFLLIEFKTRFADLQREGEKTVKRLLIRSLYEPANKDLISISQHCHYVAIGATEFPVEINGRTVRDAFLVAPYAVLGGPLRSEEFHSHARLVDTFLDQLIAGALGVENTPFLRYLALMQAAVDTANSHLAREQEKVNKANKAGSAGTQHRRHRVQDAVPGGIITAFAADGTVRLQPYDTLPELRDLSLAYDGLSQGREHERKQMLARARGGMDGPSR